jgi:CheY-like chemotaxis protein
VEPSQRPRVLSAHGDRSFNEVLCRSLQELGCSPLSAPDGPAALHILRTQPVHLAILDVGLPAMDGIQVVLAARTSGRAFHVAFVDAHERPEVRRTCLALGALAYTVRPVSQESLSRIVRRASEQPPPQAAVANNGLSDPLAHLAGGVRVRLCVGTGPSAGTYTATVVEKNLASLVVSPDVPDRAHVYVSLGTSVLVGFPVPHGWGEFASRVTGSYVGSSETEIMVSRPDRVFYRERRGDARLEVSLPMHAWPAGGRDPAGSMVRGQTEDIGRHGLRALLRDALPPESMLVLAISATGDVAETRLLGRSVWHEALDSPDGVWHRHGFRFVGLGPEARQQLAALLAHLQSLGEGTASGPGRGASPEASHGPSPADAGEGA